MFSCQNRARAIIRARDAFEMSACMKTLHQFSAQGNMTMWLILLALPSFLCALIAPPCTTVSKADSTDATIRIAIVGDSTVADYAPDDPHRGWGQLFPEFVNIKRVTVQNFAVNGRSTKTFKSEGRWEPVLAFKPDYIFIQFGHNDSHARGRPEATDARTDYSDNLREYVLSARAHGATPILVTPMHRGTWDAGGRHLTQELLPYADAVRRVAAENKVVLVDLYALSEKSFERMGAAGLDAVFALPDKDRTHFNEKGARLLARLVAEETARIIPALKEYLRLPPRTSTDTVNSKSK
jgi:lysophospholipase L1-like esterase